MSRVGHGPTNRQRILVAAAKLEQPFHETQLVLAAWRADPERFGLKGCDEPHPDANLIRCEVMGKARLVGRGYMERVGERTYRITESGRAEADAASNGNRRELGPDRKLLRYRIVFAQRAPAMLTSYAFLRWRESAIRMIGLYHVFSFYGCRMDTSARKVREAVERVGAMLAIVTSGHVLAKPVRCPSGQELGKADARRLLDCHSWIVHRFGRHWRDA